MKLKNILLAAALITCILAPVSVDAAGYDNLVGVDAQNGSESVLNSSERNSVMLTDAEKEILLRVGESEAGDQGATGIALVMRVVLNRAADYRFPNTIEGVVFQPYQFSVISNGSYWYKTPGTDCYTALQMIEDGWDESYGSLYFCEGWFSWANYTLSYKSHNFFR